MIDGWGKGNKKARREKGLSLEFDAISILTRIYGDVAFLRARLSGFRGRFEVRLSRLDCFRLEIWGYEYI